MPSLAASFGPWMCTSSPSNRIWPLSAACDARDALDQRRLPGAVVADEGHDLAVPHLEVDVGQRLHRAERLRDASELKERSLVHRRRVSYHKSRWRRPAGRLHRIRFDLLAVLLVDADADVALLQELVREEPLVVRLRDPDHRKRQRRLILRAVLPERVRLRLRALDQRDGGCSSSVRLVRHVLVDGTRLPAGEDVLDTLRARVLPAERDRLEMAGLEVGDHGAGDVVVRRDCRRRSCCSS